jgi:hypothetical protein
MLIYRFLSGEDDSAFCHKVTKALSEGWTLYGTPQYAFDPEARKMRVGQAVTAEAPQQPYDPDRKLTDYLTPREARRVGFLAGE